VSRSKNLFGLFFLIFFAPSLPSVSQADPVPGDVFREYHFANGRGIHLCTQNAERDTAEFSLFVDDLHGAIKAELTGNFHTGHIGTSERRITINDGAGVDLPAPEMPAGMRGECYFTYIFGRPSVEVNLADIKVGENRLTLSVGPQICHGFNYPCYGFHNVTLRIYYGSNKPHPTGEIVYPVSGQVISNDEVMIKTGALQSETSIGSVDIVGYYYDYPFEGSGKYLDWHYMIDEYGRWFSFINRTKRSPYHETWDLSWLPDQTEPMKLMARITDVDGISFMTSAVENLVLEREGRSVKIYKTTDIPENFKVRIGETMKSHFEPITDDLNLVSAAQLVSLTPVGHLEKKYLSLCGINGVKIKQYERLPDLHTDFFYDTNLPIDPAILKQGVNEFHVYSDTDGHMTEVCWPGPALLLSSRTVPGVK
jgi:hypothetical protein